MRKHALHDVAVDGANGGRIDRQGLKSSSMSSTSTPMREDSCSTRRMIRSMSADASCPVPLRPVASVVASVIGVVSMIRRGAAPTYAKAPRLYSLQTRPTLGEVQALAF